MGYLDKPATWGWGLRILAFIGAAACGYVYWAHADWWTYIQYTPTERVRKFEVPLEWKIAESTLVGLLVGGLCILLLFFVQRRIRRRDG